MILPHVEEVGTTGGFSPASILTREELLDHVRRPRNRGELPGADIVQEEANPLCGDVVTVYARVATEEASAKSYKLKAISFAGSGCIISQAAASMLTEAVRGKSEDEVLRMERADIEALLGGQLSPSRVKCGMLALVALKNGLQAVRPAHAVHS